jgi:hypothetical protein
MYYEDFGDFPFNTDTNSDNVLDALDDYLIGDLLIDLNGTVIPPDTLFEETDGAGNTVFASSSAALFYFLDKNPSSRAIVETVANTLVSNKGVDGTTPIKITIGGTEYDLPRYIDPWGMSIRYEYLPGTVFPILTSAGPDTVFDTPDDITSK